MSVFSPTASATAPDSTVPEPMSPVPRILVRGVNWLGDAVMALPALERLREAQPRAHLALLTDVKLADLWRLCPAIDEVLTFTAGETVWRVARRLRAGGFDLAMVLPNSPRAALETWLAGIPQRVGYARPWRNWCLTRPVIDRPEAFPMRRRTVAEIRRLTGASRVLARARLAPMAHQTHHYLHLVAACGASPQPLAPRLVLTDADLAGCRRKFDLDPTTRWLGLNAGAEYGPAKRWPLENFAAVAKSVAAWPAWGILVLGGEADVALAGEIAAALPLASVPVRNLAGQTTLRELCAVLSVCRVLLTNDTGPMHVAAAVRTPTVVPFGSTSPALTGPGWPGDRLHQLLTADAPCAPCFRRVCPIDLRCLRGITVTRVLEAVRTAAGSDAAPG